MQAVSLGWSCPPSPRSRRCSWTRWAPAPGAAPCAEGLSSRARHGARSRRGQFITGARPVVRRGAAGAARVQRQARRSAHGRRAGPVQPGAWMRRGREAADGTAGSQRDRPTGTDQVAAGLLADGLTRCLAAGIECVTLAAYLLKVITIVVRPVPGCARSPTRHASWRLARPDVMEYRSNTSVLVSRHVPADSPCLPGGRKPHESKGTYLWQLRRRSWHCPG
jgi:hypothetical protein